MPSSPDCVSPVLSKGHDHTPLVTSLNVDQRESALSAMRAHYWLMFTFYLPGCWVPDLQSYFPAHYSAAWWLGLFLPRRWASHFSLLSSMSHLFAQFSSLPLLTHSPFTCSQLCIAWGLFEGALCPIIQAISKNVKGYWPWYGSLRCTISSLLPAGLPVIHNITLDALFCQLSINLSTPVTLGVFYRR